jgi:hypothetical protein
VKFASGIDPVCASILSEARPAEAPAVAIHTRIADDIHFVGRLRVGDRVAAQHRPAAPDLGFALQHDAFVDEAFDAACPRKGR